jgi:pyruvate dehydrogenase E2 component (dihydrolipoamide acetyltransferase)/2-oxoisovalerate dehydrogenase E2 component (dihydrolipoyl transacylase)
MDFSLPEIGEGVFEAELVSWLVKPGEAVKRGQNLVEVLTDKATMEVPSPFAGTITELQAEPGQLVKVGQVLLSYQPGGREQTPMDRVVIASEAREKARAPAAAATPPAPSPPQGNGDSGGGLPVKAAPSVRLMARKLGIDLGQVQGSGPEGRILLDDLSAAARRMTAEAPDSAPPGTPRQPQPDYGTPGTRIKVQGLRRKIAEHMVLSKRTIPHYSYVDECDVTELVRLREGLREAGAQTGVKITYLAFFVKAVVAALKEVPLVNASLDEGGGEIVLHDRYNIGIAVAAPQGLIVPVVQAADKKDLFQVAREIERLSAEARAGRARLEDLRGGTFTITSVGNLGGLISTPIINHPEVAILGVGKVVKRPVFDAVGNVRPADIVYLSLSFDHRVVDGAVGAAFGNVILKQLQNPVALLVPPLAAVQR